MERRLFGVDWYRSDIENALDFMLKRPSEENVDKVLEVIDWNEVDERMIEAGWDVIYRAIDKAFKEV